MASCMPNAYHGAPGFLWCVLPLTVICHYLKEPDGAFLPLLASLQWNCITITYITITKGYHEDVLHPTVAGKSTYPNLHSIPHLESPSGSHVVPLFRFLTYSTQSEKFPTGRWRNSLTNQPTDRPTEQPTEQKTDRPTNRPSNQPTNQPSNQSTNQPTDRPTDRPTDLPTDHPTNQPTNQPINLSTYQPTNQPTS